MSIIIPTKGSIFCLEKCINSILNLGYPDFELIIVDDGLKDNDYQLLNEYKEKIKILKSDSRGPSFARNLAAKNTDAEFIAFTDSDCIVDKNWLKELLRGFEEFPEAVACGGTQELPSDATNFERGIFLFMKKVGFITDYMRKTGDDKIIEINHNASCCVMYKRDIFLKEGGFLEGLWPGEDVELDYRLKRKGYKLVFNPKAVVYHYRPKDLKSFLKMMYKYGWAQGFLVRKYGVFRKIQFLPFVTLSIFLVVIYSLFIDVWYVPMILTFFLFIAFKFNFCLIFLSLLGFAFWHWGFIKRFLRQGE